MEITIEGFTSTSLWLAWVNMQFSMLACWKNRRGTTRVDGIAALFRSVGLVNVFSKSVFNIWLQTNTPPHMSTRYLRNRLSQLILSLDSLFNERVSGFTVQVVMDDSIVFLDCLLTPSFKSDPYLKSTQPANSCSWTVRVAADDNEKIIKVRAFWCILEEYSQGIVPSCDFSRDEFWVEHQPISCEPKTSWL